MEAENTFLKQLEGYFDLELNNYDKGRVLSYLQEYVNTLPVHEPKIVTTERIIIRHLKDTKIIAKRQTSNIDPYAIINLVSFASGITNRQMLGKDRYAEIVVSRHVAMYLIRTICQISLHNIGKLFNRDHTTVISAINHVVTMLETNPDDCLTLIDYVNRNLPIPEEKTA